MLPGLIELSVTLLSHVLYLMYVNHALRYVRGVRRHSETGQSGRCGATSKLGSLGFRGLRLRTLHSCLFQTVWPRKPKQPLLQRQKS